MKNTTTYKWSKILTKYNRHAKEGSLFQYIIKQPNRYVAEREAALIIK